MVKINRIVYILNRAFLFPWQPKLSAILLKNMAASETSWTADYAGSKQWHSQPKPDAWAQTGQPPTCKSNYINVIHTYTCPFSCEHQ